MLSEAPPSIRAFIRFFLLPYCFFKLIDWQKCNKPKFSVVNDLLTLFFKYKAFPDHYSPCRLWEKNRAEWAYYYGSGYNPYQRYKFRETVQPFKIKKFLQNKLKCEEYFKAKGIPMPITYGIISPGENCEEIIKDLFTSIPCDKLIIKPLFGKSGRGVALAVKTLNGIVFKRRGIINSVKSFSVAEPSIIQEVIIQHESISQYSPFSVNTIRTVPFLTRDNSVIMLSACMRFSVGDSVVDNWSAGGIAVGVNCVKGILMEFAFDKNGNMHSYHPISSKIFCGFKIPFWDQIYELTKKTQLASPDCRLIGLDIAVTPQGPVVIEINPEPDLILQEQTSGPLLKDPIILKEFARYNLLYNSQQTKLLNIRF